MYVQPVYIKYILYNTNIFFISLLNAFQLYLLRAAIYIYIYMYVYIKYILYHTDIFFISLLNALQLYLFRAAIYI